MISMAAHTEYWGGRPKLDRLIVKNAPDAATIPSLLRSSAVDVARDVQRHPVHRVRRILEGLELQGRRDAGLSSRYTSSSTWPTRSSRT